MRGVKEEYGQAGNAYLVNHLGRTQAEDFAPYSAQSVVSSFNIPLSYNSSLVTPVSATSTPNLTTKPNVSMNMDPHIKSSPIALSPSYGVYSPENEFYPNPNPPMKHRDSVLQISICDNLVPPGSPFACSSPYFGSYGVSAQSQAGKVSEPSPMFQNSPSIQSAVGYSSSGYYSRAQTPALSASGYKSNSQTPVPVVPGPSSPPILIAPNPSILKPATINSSSGGQRRNLKPSNQMSRPFRKSPEQKYSSAGPHNPSKVQKPAGKRSQAAQPATYEKLMAATEVHKVTQEERYLLQLRVRDGIKWEDIQDQYNLAFPGKHKAKACLQMRKLRLIERLLTWNDLEDRALKLAREAIPWTGRGEWKAVAQKMPKFGSKHKWSAEGCKKHWEEMENQDSMSQYERAQSQAENHRRLRTSSSEFHTISPSQQSWSDGAASVSHSPFSDLPGHFLTALSSASMDDSRSSTASDASVEQQMQQQSIGHMQQEIMFQQNQQSQQQQHRQYSQSSHHQAQQSRHSSWPSGH